jgi:hypothetical protein
VGVDLIPNPYKKDWDEKFEIVNLEEFRIKREQLKKNLERLNIK